MANNNNPAYRVAGGDTPHVVHELALIIVAADLANMPQFRQERIHPVPAREIAMRWITAPESHREKEYVRDGYRAAWLLYRALPSLGWTHDGKKRDVAACIVAGVG